MVRSRPAPWNKPEVCRLDLKMSEKERKDPKRWFRSRRVRKAGRDLAWLSAFVCVALTARASLADHYVVPTGSMRPTVAEGDRVFVFKAAYGIRVPLTHW